VLQSYYARIIKSQRNRQTKKIINDYSFKTHFTGKTHAVTPRRFVRFQFIFLVKKREIFFDYAAKKKLKTSENWTNSNSYNTWFGRLDVKF